MDNGNDLPARIPCLEISDEKHDSNKWLHLILVVLANCSKSAKITLC